MVHKTLWIYSGPVSGNHEVIVVITVITTNVLDRLSVAHIGAREEMTT